MNEKSKNVLKDIAKEIDVFDDMITSLVELLEEKDIITQEEWEKKIKAKLERNTTSNRNIQFES